MRINQKLVKHFLISLRLVVSAFILLFVTAVNAESKKLICYGEDWPNTAYVRAHISEMEKFPFDGVVIAVSDELQPKYSGDCVGFRAWGKQRFDPTKYQHAIDDLKNTSFKKFKDNFLAVEAMPGDVDWFSDDDFAGVAQNLKLMAKIAHEGGCRGIEFDPEEYGANKVWTWASWPEAIQKKHTEEECITIARQRGREIMRAMNSEFPDIKVMFLLGPGYTTAHTVAGNHKYRLLLPFIDGMCEVAAQGTQIIDGYEQSYGFRTPISFEDAVANQKQAKNFFQDKNAFDRVMRVGFGLWMDNNSGAIGWHPTEPEKNHFQPGTWQTAIHYALKNSDEYVWIWHERYNLWANQNLSPAYFEAQEKGRLAPGRIATTEMPKQVRQPHAAQLKGHDDASTFADLMQSHHLLLDLNQSKWELALDPQNQGAKGATWKPIQIGKFWEEQGYDYDGIAWYRTKFNLPETSAKNIILAVGAADESAWVYLNGELVATHDIGEGGWEQRFTTDITKHVKPGENDLLIRVLDRTGPGGLWKGIKIFGSK